MIRFTLSSIFALCLTPLTAHAVAIEWATVANPGNAADPDTGLGSVAEVYRISQFEVTNAQYAEFLNAVAATDPVALYNTQMDSSTHGGITRSGSPGGFLYAVKPGMGNKPVNFVSFYDALRFANWLHNGQPVGEQGATTTEDGAYTLLGGMPEPTNRLDTPRNSAATVFLPSEDEWYKAAFYNAVLSSYLDYPAGTNAQTVCALPGATPNTANCESVVGSVTEVGAYTGSASPNSTFDQGGNVWEWNEGHNGSLRGLGDGSFDRSSSELAASDRNYSDPLGENETFGFRVASVPEPGTGLLLMSGLLVLASWHRHVG